MSATDRQRRSRCFRTAIRWLVGVFLLLQISIAVAIDQSGPAVRNPEYALLETMLKKRLADRPDAPSAVFIGSSRVAHGFDAARAAAGGDGVVFNFGIPGAGPFFEEIVLDRLRSGAFDRTSCSWKFCTRSTTQLGRGRSIMACSMAPGFPPARPLNC